MQHHSVLHLLKAEHLPHSRADLRQAGNETMAHALTITARIAVNCSDLEILMYVTKALQVLPLKIVTTSYNQQEKATLLQERYEEHDDFFAVMRVVGDPLYVFTQSILHAYSLVLDDTIAAGTMLNAEEWRRLRDSFEVMLKYIRAHSVVLDYHFTEHMELPSIVQRELVPLHRWRVGHQVFFVLIQSLVVAFSCLRDSLHTNHLQDANAALELATCLMWGSASALRFAGDFHSEQYEGGVRLAMMPPHLEPGFSGLQMRDHRYLIYMLKQLRPMLLHLDQRLEYQYHQFMQALAATYEAHKFVCARFGGNEERSLRMPAESTKSSVEVLDDLKYSRLQLVRR